MCYLGAGEFAKDETRTGHVSAYLRAEARDAVQGHSDASKANVVSS
jgi:hypothetical protein